MTARHPFVFGADADEMVPFRNDELPPELQVGFVVGHCGHRVAGSEWKAGMRYCERCPDPKGTDR
jgi:hypothetical protein